MMGGRCGSVHGVSPFLVLRVLDSESRKPDQHMPHAGTPDTLLAPSANVAVAGVLQGFSRLDTQWAIAPSDAGWSSSGRRMLR